jgi:peptide/nickel transport system substrate-binding protein
MRRGFLPPPAELESHHHRNGTKLPFGLSIISAAILVVCVVTSTAGCAPERATSSPNYAVVGIENGPVSLDPRYATDAIGSHIDDLVFDGLTQVDEQGRYSPHLAAGWTTRDSRTFEFRLREGFRFHDGTPLTSADVKATFDSVRDPAANSPKRQSLVDIEAIETPDPLTVRFHLKETFAPFLDSTTLGILPAAAVAASPRQQIAEPIGSGPFQLAELVPDERVVLRRFERYAMRPPRLAGVTFRVLPDSLVRLLELHRGELDLVQNAVDPDSLDWLRRQPDVQVLTRPGTTFQYLGMNLRDPRLADVRVRQAIAHAIDRGALIRTVLRGFATPATGLLSPGHWAYDGSGATYAHNPKRAAELLDEAGYLDPDGDGPAPRFRLSYKTTTVDVRKRIAEVIQDQLRRVGIALEIRVYEWGTFYGDIKRGNFHLYSLAWVGVADPDVYYLTCHSSQVPPIGNNRGFFLDETVDALTAKARRTLVSEDRRELYGEVQRRLGNLLPVIPLWWTTNVAVVNPRLRGFDLTPDGGFRSLQHAWIEEP